MIGRSKQFFDPYDPLDAEQLLNYLEELDTDNDEYQTIQDSECLDILLFLQKTNTIVIRKTP
ncbi:uncharacterized protein [Leptinotarsa decemlineata]|uniref:uncharacterized protein n=1 Tax=Leptinotarsa decemlineata TaxID=7539 RepID=UPI003D304E78